MFWFEGICCQRYSSFKSVGDDRSAEFSEFRMTWPVANHEDKIFHSVTLSSKNTSTIETRPSHLVTLSPKKPCSDKAVDKEIPEGIQRAVAV